MYISLFKCVNYISFLFCCLYYGEHSAHPTCTYIAKSFTIKTRDGVSCGPRSVGSATSKSVFHRNRCFYTSVALNSLKKIFCANSLREGTPNSEFELTLPRYAPSRFVLLLCIFFLLQDFFSYVCFSLKFGALLEHLSKV